EALEVLAACLMLADPLLGELAALDLGEDLLHLGPCLIGNDARTAGQVSVLGRIGDRVPHSLDALLVDQIDDQLQLVQALEIGETRVVAGLDEGLESGLDQRRGAAAEDRLLTEEVGLALVLEGGLDDAGSATSDAGGIGEHQATGIPGRV